MILRRPLDDFSQTVNPTTFSRENRNQKIISAIVLILISAFIYGGFLSANYDLNGIIEAHAIDAGGPELFSPNHILYRPLIWLFHVVLYNLGYTNSLLLVAQIITALFGILGLYLFYWWIYGLTNQNIVALIASLGFGTSWSYWVFSTDIYYITPAAATLLGSIILLTGALTNSKSFPNIIAILGSGICCGISILFWQANIFFILPASFGLFVKYSRDRKQLLVALGMFLAGVSIVVGSGYLLAGYLAIEAWSVSNFLNWLLNYGGARLPIWGKWSLDRVVSAGVSFVSSLIPVWDGLGLRALLRGEFQTEKLIAQLSLVAFFLLVSLPLLGQIKKRTIPPYKIRILLYILLGFISYLPFIIWWDPFEPKWFVIPNIGFWAILAILWDVSVSRSFHLGLLTTIILTISLANFSSTIWPRHSEMNIPLQRAECIAEVMTSKDIFVTTDWNWGGYLNYPLKRNTFSLIAAPSNYGGKEEALTVLDKIIDRVHEANGKVYIVNIDTYSSEHMNWLNAQTELTKEDFQHFEVVPAFSCNEVEVHELVKLQ